MSLWSDSAELWFTGRGEQAAGPPAQHPRAPLSREAQERPVCQIQECCGFSGTSLSLSTMGFSSGIAAARASSAWLLGS
jgi:hypothetical protein